jgi:hypothetical protein
MFLIQINIYNVIVDLSAYALHGVFCLDSRRNSNAVYIGDDDKTHSKIFPLNSDDTMMIQRKDLHGNDNAHLKYETVQRDLAD